MKKVFILYAILIIFFLIGIILFPRIKPSLIATHFPSTYKLLPGKIELAGSKQIVKKTLQFPGNTLKGKDVIKLSFNLHGLCLLEGKASEIGFEDQIGNIYPVSLSQYASDCYDGE